MNRLKRTVISQCDVDEGRAGRAMFREFLETVRNEIPTEELDSHIAAIESELPNSHENGHLELSAEDIETLYANPARLEELYVEVVSKEDRRNDGQFFTPTPVAEFMAAQVPTEAKRVLDPTMGTGVFLDALCSRELSSLRSLVGVDVDPLMIFAACIRLSLIDSNVDDVSLSN